MECLPDPKTAIKKSKISNNLENAGNLDFSYFSYELNEVWNPSLFVCSEIDKLADEYSMLKTCGTDSHGFSLLGR